MAYIVDDPRMKRWHFATMVIVGLFLNGSAMITLGQPAAFGFGAISSSLYVCAVAIVVELSLTL